MVVSTDETGEIFYQGISVSWMLVEDRGSHSMVEVIHQLPDGPSTVSSDRLFDAQPDTLVEVSHSQSCPSDSSSPWPTSMSPERPRQNTGPQRTESLSLVGSLGGGRYPCVFPPFDRG